MNNQEKTPQNFHPKIFFPLLNVKSNILFLNEISISNVLRNEAHVSCVEQQGSKGSTRQLKGLVFTYVFKLQFLAYVIFLKMVTQIKRIKINSIFLFVAVSPPHVGFQWCPSYLSGTQITFLLI